MLKPVANFFGILLTIAIFLSGCGQAIISLEDKSNDVEVSMATGTAQFTLDGGLVFGAALSGDTLALLPASFSYTQLFTFSTPNAYYFGTLNSLDFDLAVTNTVNFRPTLDCRVRFPVVTPASAFISNPDGVEPSGVAYINYGHFTLAPGYTKTRRVELNTGGGGAVTISVDLVCWQAPVNIRTPNMATVFPTIGSINDVITLTGFNLDSNPTTTVASQINTINAPILTSTRVQAQIQVPNTTSGALSYSRSFAVAGITLTDQIGFFRVDAILGESINDGGNAPATGVLVTALYPPGSVNPVDGCPTQPATYLLNTFGYGLASGVNMHDSPRVPPGNYDELIWLNPGTGYATKPLAGALKVQNLSNPVVIQANQRTAVSHQFSGTYSADCP